MDPRGSVKIFLMSGEDVGIWFQNHHFHFLYLIISIRQKKHLVKAMSSRLFLYIIVLTFWKHYDGCCEQHETELQGIKTKSFQMQNITNQVLLHKCKRHTARRVSSTPYAALSQGGVPHPEKGSDTSHWGTPQEGTWNQSLGYPPGKDMVPVEVLRDGDGVPP